MLLTLLIELSSSTDSVSESCLLALLVDLSVFILLEWLNVKKDIPGNETKHFAEK